jgi:prepilin-type N-terminal cleavage/methylation domain-containing protein
MAERRWTRLRRREDGMTMIEMMVAVALMSVALIAMITTFDASRSLVSTSEKNSVAAHQGEREVEKALTLAYKNIALVTTPAHSASSSSPDYYANSDGTYQWDQSVSPKPAEPMVTDASLGLLTHASTWSDGQSRLSGSIYRFVTWVDDPNIAGTQNAKRLTIAVTVDNIGPQGPKKPVIVSSIAIDPKAG